MTETPRGLFDSVEQWVRWWDRSVRFKQAINALPALLAKGPPGEMLGALLAADFAFGGSDAPSDRARGLFVLTSHHLYVFPQGRSRVIGFEGERQLPSLWRIDNAKHTIEVPFISAETLPKSDDEPLDPEAVSDVIILHVNPKDWAAANAFWATGLTVSRCWGDLPEIERRIAEMIG